MPKLRVEIYSYPPSNPPLGPPGGGEGAGGAEGRIWGGVGQYMLDTQWLGGQKVQEKSRIFRVFRRNSSTDGSSS